MGRLFKNIDEIKKYCPMIGSSDFENFAPFIDVAQREFFKPYLGSEFLDELINVYNNDEQGSQDGVSESQQAAILKIQASLAFYMEYLWIPSGQVSIGDNGIRIAYTDTLRPAFAWQIKDLRREVIRMAGSAMDDLLEFLEENKDEYETWTESDVYPDFKETFISSAKEFTKYFSPLSNSRLNFLALRPTIIKIQEFTIQSELGVEFYEELKEQFKDDDLTPENEKVIELISKALANLTISQGIRNMSASIDERGVLMFNSTTASEVVDAKQPAADTMISKMEIGCDSDGRAYLSMLKKFLNDNISDYTTYSQSTAYTGASADDTFKSGPEDNIFAMI